ncbi:uncharacterized protein B0H18DRAFT_956715 [Fomitopsis serialis]|uniref:uncharacterized protein n=1 Tax=Fomitopsis serialis TaxID=139415 RepID=UPI0020084152|nr:uncharacterized protein B0H18DRAFT_956715 [Neoantrodia serialis]KAH9921098.1 hypothetical protein B0H18DRAFT_956715 [Neoantrodia serialis]
MPIRKRKICQAIANLGDWVPRKRQKQSSPCRDASTSPPSRPETPPTYGEPVLQDPNTTPMTHRVYTTFGRARERLHDLAASLASLLDEITRPTWQQTRQQTPTPTNPEKDSNTHMDVDSNAEPSSSRSPADSELPYHGRPTASPTPSRQVTIEDVPDVDDICQPGSSSEGSQSNAETHGKFVSAPSTAKAEAAWQDICNLLRPRRKSGKGFKHFSGDKHLQMMRATLQNYTDPIEPMSWKKASIEAVRALDGGSGTAESVRRWCQAYIADRNDLPHNLYGMWNESILTDDELVSEIHLHLQGTGKQCKAADIIQFFQTPEVQEKYELDGYAPSLTTAQRWMHKMDYCWSVGPRGQYIDGHKREDVVTYRQNVFLPALADIEDRLQTYDANGDPIPYSDNALSARKMPKGPSPSQPCAQRFGVDIKVKDGDGKLVHGTDGKPLKHHIKMGDAKFADGSMQHLYYPDTFPEHPELAGKFKGMAQLLIERYPKQRTEIMGLRTECPKFNCPKGRTNCCCRRMLFSERDFADVQSLVEEACSAQGCPVYDASICTTGK